MNAISLYIGRPVQRWRLQGLADISLTKHVSIFPHSWAEGARRNLIWWWLLPRNTLQHGLHTSSKRSLRSRACNFGGLQVHLWHSIAAPGQVDATFVLPRALASTCFSWVLNLLGHGCPRMACLCRPADAQCQQTACRARRAPPLRLRAAPSTLPCFALHSLTSRDRQAPRWPCGSKFRGQCQRVCTEGFLALALDAVSRVLVARTVLGENGCC